VCLQEFAKACPGTFLDCLSPVVKMVPRPFAALLDSRSNHHISIATDYDLVAPVSDFQQLKRNLSEDDDVLGPSSSNGWSISPCSPPHGLYRI
jgi:hypothetical protein